MTVKIAGKMNLKLKVLSQPRNNWNRNQPQNPVHPNYHEFYGFYSDLARNVAERTMHFGGGELVSKNGGVLRSVSNSCYFTILAEFTPRFIELIFCHNILF